MTIAERIIGKSNDQFRQAAYCLRTRLGDWPKPSDEPFWRVNFNRNTNQQLDHLNRDIHVIFENGNDIKNESDNHKRCPTSAEPLSYNQLNSCGHCLKIIANDLIDLQLIKFDLNQAVLPIYSATNNSQTASQALYHLQHYRFKWQPTANWLPAFIAYLDCWFSPQDALCLALATRSMNGQLNWPTNLDDLPTPIDLPQPLPLPLQSHQTLPFLPTHLSPIYAIVPNANWIERLCKQNISTIQLRIKTDQSKMNMDSAVTDSKTLSNLSATKNNQATLEHINQKKIKIKNEKETEEEIVRAVAIGRHYGCQVWINDNWQAAIRAGAYGVHLGQEDLHQADLPAILRAGLRLGISTHGYYEMSIAHVYQPSYLALGSIFATKTKQLTSTPQGVQRLQHYVASIAKRYTTVAIGGIDENNLAKLTKTGVDSVAMVSALTKAPNLEEAVAKIKKIRNTE